MSDIVVVYPCAACKIQRRKCGNECTLAPYFPPNDPHKFLLVHKLYGTSNITKMLQDIPVEKRGEAATSLVYETSARANDPIYGCAGAICQLQKQVLDLQSQLATLQAELINSQSNLPSLISGFPNSSGLKNVLSERIVDENYPYSENGTSMDELTVWQDFEDPFGLWGPL